MSGLSERLRGWSPPERWRRVLAVDAHTEGEPLRVVISGFPALEGATVLERRRAARERHDGLRRTLMWEPRGHSDMYGCLVGPPVTAQADLSVLFTHNDGFSTMCGHGIIGVVTVLIETGLLRPEETVAWRGGDAEPDGHAEMDGHVDEMDGEAEMVPGDVVIGIDTPAGYVEARARLEEGRVSRVSFVNVPSFAARLGASVDVPGVGHVAYDLGYGGAFYAYVSAADHDFRLTPDEAPRLAERGRRIKEALQNADPPRHPDDEDLGFVYGTIFVGPAHDPAHHSRNVCVFADGEIDRCPTGTGVSGRLALHHARGEVASGEDIVVESILGTCFTGRVVETARVGETPAVIPMVSGRAWITGVNELLVDPSDPLAEGFLLR